MVVVVQDIGQNQGGAVQPRHRPQGRQIRGDHEIAVAALPIGGGVARHRLHVNVIGQQIIAAMRLAVGGIENEFGLVTLADQAAVHIGEGDLNGVDGAFGDGRALGVQPPRGRLGGGGLAVPVTGRRRGGHPPRPAPRSLYQRRHFASPPAGTSFRPR